MSDEQQCPECEVGVIVLTGARSPTFIQAVCSEACGWDA